MRELTIALGLIQQGDNFLLQLRNGPAKIGGAGLIGCFGGKINDGEDPLIAICREIFEETSLQPLPDQLRKLGVVRVDSDHQLEPVQVIGHVYHWHLDRFEEPRISEGELVVMTLDEAKSNLDKFTTGTRAVFEELI